MLERTPLTELFAPADLERWQELVQEATPDRPLARLNKRSDDGIEIQALYTADNAGPMPSAAWARRAVEAVDLCALELAGDDLAARLHEDEEGGANSVLLSLEASTDPRWVGALAGRSVALLLGGPGNSSAHAEVLFEAWQNGPSGSGGNLGQDPYADSNPRASLDWVGKLAGEGSHRRAVAIDGAPWHDAGATSAQQLGCLLAATVELLREAESRGLALEDVIARTDLRLRLGTHFFEGIASVRAWRWAWAQVAHSCGLEVAPRVHALASSRMTARRDAWVNLLRNTAAAFAAVVGGADVVSCEPYDAALGKPGASGRRLARNTLLLLTEESHLQRVLDPAAGSWFLEGLTRELGQAAWSFFQQIEAEGGFAKVLAGGWLRAQIDASWAREEKALAKRKKPVTGVSEFPWLAEPTNPGSATGGEGEWPLRRLAEPFEALRDASDTHLARTGSRPRARLVQLGRVADSVVRSTWSRNFLEAGGIEVLAGDGPYDVDEAVAEFTASGAAIAVICSSDKVYEADAVVAARALKSAGARTVVLAGRPGGNEAALREAGVDRFIHVGCDVRDVLRELLKEEGVAL